MGPYRLCGLSFGTSVSLVFSKTKPGFLSAYMAFVIVQMLQQTGETVELLIMIDGSPAIFDNFTMKISTTDTWDEVRPSPTVSIMLH
jgi:thioesterase domain-containing protein